MVELGAAMRLTVLLGLWSSLFAPWGIATGTAPAAVALGALAFAAKTALLGAVLAAGEVFMAKLRLFRVPELLAGSFLLATLAVTASFFLT
jgi:formate hydrogenlyase subunit 4